MKNSFVVIAVLLIALLFCSCLPEKQPNDISPEISQNSIPEISESEAVDLLLDNLKIYEEMVIFLDAERIDDGSLQTPKFSLFFASLFYDEEIEDFSALENKYYFAWAQNYFEKLYGDAQKELFPPQHNPGGYAYPTEEYEITVHHFFGVEPETLKDGVFYCSEHNSYTSPSAMMGGEGYNKVEITGAVQDKNILTLELNVYSLYSEEPITAFLEIELYPDGGWKYLSLTKK